MRYLHQHFFRNHRRAYSFDIHFAIPENISNPVSTTTENAWSITDRAFFFLCISRDAHQCEKVCQNAYVAKVFASHKRAHKQFFDWIKLLLRRIALQKCIHHFNGCFYFIRSGAHIDVHGGLNAGMSRDSLQCFEVNAFSCQHGSDS